MLVYDWIITIYTAYVYVRFDFRSVCEVPLTQIDSHSCLLSISNNQNRYQAASGFASVKLAQVIVKCSQLSAGCAGVLRYRYRLICKEYSVNLIRSDQHKVEPQIQYLSARLMLK